MPSGRLDARSGTIVDDGPTERVYTQPRHPYTRALLTAAPTLG